MVKVKFNLISASNQDLKTLVEQGKFRKDLYYRLRGFEVFLPPLRKRQEDIPLLVKHFLEEFSKGKIRLSRAAARLFYNYSWPGNIRELRNCLERACLVSGHGEIQIEDLPTEIQEAKTPALPDGVLPFLEAKKNFEKEYLQSLVKQYNGNITRAAAATGLYRQYLHRLLKKHKLD